LNIFITGSTGFVGKNIIKFLNSKHTFSIYNRKSKITIHEDTILHFAGKAHDLKKVSHTNDYYKVNYELTKEVFDAFLLSDASIFITLSSVKAVADSIQNPLTEVYIPNSGGFTWDNTIAQNKTITINLRDN
jgi:nucleoside-diphosphate-sugar epimerase